MGSTAEKSAVDPFLFACEVIVMGPKEETPVDVYIGGEYIGTLFPGKPVKTL